MLNLSKLFMRLGIGFFQTLVNADILTSTHEPQVCLMKTRMVNPFQKLFDLLCPDTTEELLQTYLLKNNNSSQYSLMTYMGKSGSEICTVVSSSWRLQGLCGPWDSPGQDTGVGSLSLLQGIFPTQGSNPGPPHCRWILSWLSHEGSPRRLEWIAYPFSRGSSQPRDWTRVSFIADRFFTNWAIRETHMWKKSYQKKVDIHTYMYSWCILRYSRN